MKRRRSGTGVGRWAGGMLSLAIGFGCSLTVGAQAARADAPANAERRGSGVTTIVKTVPRRSDPSTKDEAAVTPPASTLAPSHPSARADESRAPLSMGSPPLGTPARGAPEKSPPGTVWTTEVEPGGSVTAIALETEGKTTRLVLTMPASATVLVSSLAEPYRIVIDLGPVAFALPEGSRPAARGLVQAVRFGLFAPSRNRIVLDTEGPVEVGSPLRLSLRQRGQTRLVLPLVSTTPSAYVVTPPADRELRGSTPAAGSEEAHAVATAPRQGRPVVLLDPGHGGIDSGAVGRKVLEKQVALGVAKHLAARLTQIGAYDVHLTRSEDVFVSLDERVRISRRLGAELFVSLHADALAATELAHAIRGASVYTLSDRASNERARRLAEKENASDILAGLDAGAAPGDDHVTNILLDLMQRESAELSAHAQRFVLQGLRGRVLLARDSRRSAAFKVLKQSHAAAVLIELGYMSNAKDEQLLASSDWQQKAAAAIAAAIDRHFVAIGRRTPAR